MNDASATRPMPPRPAPLELVRAWFALNAMIGDNPALAAVQSDIKLAALHIDDAVKALAHQEEQDNQ